MRIAPLADVKARLSAYVGECGTEGPVVITRNGKAVAVLLTPYDDDDLERLMLGRSPRFQALLNRSRQSIQEGKGLSEKSAAPGFCCAAACRCRNWSRTVRHIRAHALLMLIASPTRS